MWYLHGERPAAYEYEAATYEEAAPIGEDHHHEEEDPIVEAIHEAIIGVHMHSATNGTTAGGAQSRM